MAIWIYRLGCDETALVLSKELQLALQNISPYWADFTAKCIDLLSSVINTALGAETDNKLTC